MTLPDWSAKFVLSKKQSPNFNTAKHADRLLTIIHKPGWTTEPEHELVVAHLDSFHSQVSGLHKACDTLLTIAEKIGLNPQPLPP